MADHFSEDDARRIFARAAERQGTRDAPEAGLSLEELEAIGEESGIDPSYIAAAATELRAGARTPPSGSDFGVPRNVEAVRVLPEPVTDDAWARMVDDLRTTFSTAGMLTEIGQTREWAAGQLSGRDGVRFTVRPRPDGGAEIIARHSLDANIQSIKLLGGVGVLAAAMLIGVAFLSGDASFVAFSLAVSLLVAVAIGIPTWGLRRSALRAEGEFEALLDRAERFAGREAERASALATSLPFEPGDATPLLDLPDAEAPESETHRRRRRRTR